MLSLRIMVTATAKKTKKKLPDSFRPLLWWLRWGKLDVWKDRRNIILAALTHGRLEHIKWIIEIYGKDEINRELSRCLKTELHLGARNLARVLFGVSEFKHAR